MLSCKCQRKFLVCFGFVSDREKTTTTTTTKNSALKWPLAHFAVPLVSGESLDGGTIQNAHILTEYESLVLQAFEDFTDDSCKGLLVRVVD